MDSFDFLGSFDDPMEMGNAGDQARELCTWEPHGDKLMLDCIVGHLLGQALVPGGELMASGLPNKALSTALVAVVNGERGCSPVCTPRTLTARLTNLYRRYRAHTECESANYVPEDVRKTLGADYFVYLEKCAALVDTYRFDPTAATLDQLSSIHMHINWLPRIDHLIKAQRAGMLGALDAQAAHAQPSVDFAPE